MRVVIVGGTGNISTSIVRLLLEKGYDVTCYNRGMRGQLPKDVRHIKGDRKDRESFEKVMQDEKFDVAIDMICYTPEDAASGYRAFRDAGQYIYCSTTCTYGLDYDWLPVTEDHPLRPITDYGRGKVAADKLFLEAYYREKFPVTIIRPSTTYGPQIGMLRQIAWDFSWIDRIRKGKPILICGDGRAVHQFLHVDDAAKGFVGAIGKENCKGQIYNLVNKGCMDWVEHHKTAMKVLGVEVELVGIPFDNLMKFDSKKFTLCADEFGFNCYYSADKIYRDIPEFRPSITIEEGMRQVFDYMDRNNKIPNSDNETWEDELIKSQRRIGEHV